MGFEYKIQIASMNPEAFSRFLRNSSFFAEYDEQYRLYNLRLPGSTAEAGMPDASVKLEADGIYLCQHQAGCRDAMMQLLMEEARRQSNDVTVEEL
jgi:hypothetical protein